MSHPMSNCNKTELLRDYAFDELPAADRPAFERHLAECAECAVELDQLRLTTAALRILPDREPPQRIAFVSDKIYAPSKLWNFAPWLGFASAAVMAVALIVSTHQLTHQSNHQQPSEVPTVAAQSSPATPVSDEAIRQAVAEAQKQDARIFKAALATIEAKHEHDQKNLIEAINVLQARENANTLMAANEPVQNGIGQ
jgi:hypothetical protein